MGGHHNQDYYKVQGTPMRSRDIARLYRKRFTAREAVLRQRGPSRTGSPIPTAHHEPAAQATGRQAASDTAARERQKAARAARTRVAQESRAGAQVSSSLPERVSYLLPGSMRRRLRSLWRRSRRPLGITAGAVLAPLTVARLVRRLRKG